jgi:O-antigen/teichoic acid export membrane protein
MSNFAKDTLVVVFGKVINLILTFTFVLIATNELGASIYGRFVFVYTFYFLISIAISFGLDLGLIKLLPVDLINKEFDNRNNLVAFTTIISILFAIITALIIVQFSNSLSTTILNDVALSELVVLMGLILPFLVFMKITRGIFRGVEKIVPHAIAETIIFPSFKIIVFLALIYIARITDIRTLVITLVFSFFLASIYICYYLIEFFRSINFNISVFKRFIKMMVFSLPLMFNSMIIFLIAKTDILMIGYFTDTTNVGIYSVAVSISNVTSFILVAINTVFAPRISALYHQNKLKELKNIYSFVTKWGLAATLVLFSAIVLYPDAIMLSFGKDFLNGSYALIIISFGHIVNMAVGSAGYINIMTGYRKIELYNSISVLLLNVTLNYFFIPIYGIEGAAVASLVSLVLINVLRLIQIYHFHGIQPYNKGFIKVLLPALVSFIIIYVLKDVFGLTNIFWGLISLLMYSCFYAGFLFLFGIEQKEKALLKNTIKSLISRRERHENS